MAILPPKALSILTLGHVSEWTLDYVADYESSYHLSDLPNYTVHLETHIEASSLPYRLTPFTWAGAGHTKYRDIDKLVVDPGSIPEDLENERDVRTTADAGLDKHTIISLDLQGEDPSVSSSSWALHELGPDLPVKERLGDKDPTLHVELRPVPGRYSSKTINGSEVGDTASPPVTFDRAFRNFEVIDGPRLASDWQGGPSDHKHSLRLTGKPGFFLWMDGVNLHIVDVGSKSITGSFPAFSGRPGMTTDLPSQRKKNAGPTPEGLYLIDQRHTLTRDKAEDTWDLIKWVLKEPSWGTFATPLEPLADTDTFGRSAMFIHGGRVPGSIGCIDLVRRNREFHNWFATRASIVSSANPFFPSLSFGELLLVHYLPMTRTVPRTHSTPAACPDDSRFFCTNNDTCTRNAVYSGPGSRYVAERDRALALILTDIYA